MFSISSQQSKYLTLTTVFFTGVTSGLTLGYLLCKNRRSTSEHLKPIVIDKEIIKNECKNGLCPIQFVDKVMNQVDDPHN